MAKLPLIRPLSHDRHSNMSVASAPLEGPPSTTPVITKNVTGQLLRAFTESPGRLNHRLELDQNGPWAFWKNRA